MFQGLKMLRNETSSRLFQHGTVTFRTLNFPKFVELTIQRLHDITRMGNRPKGTTFSVGILH